MRDALLVDGECVDAVRDDEQKLFGKHRRHKNGNACQLFRLIVHENLEASVTDLEITHQKNSAGLSMFARCRYRHS